MVNQRLLPTHLFWSPHQLRSPCHTKEFIVGRGGPDVHCPFHHPLHGFCSILLYGYPEEFLRLLLLIPVLLGVPTHAFPILVMEVRGEVVINEGGHGADNGVVGSLDAAIGLISGSYYFPLGGEFGVGDGGRPSDVMTACICMEDRILGMNFTFPHSSPPESLLYFY